MKLKNIWRAGHGTLMCHDSNRQEFVLAEVLGSFETSKKDHAADIVTAVNTNQKLIDSLQFLADAAQAAVDDSIVASHKGAKIIGAIEIARVTLALAKDDEEAGE